MRIVDGKQYVIHDVHIYDTLMKISLRYNVPEKQIRAINKLVSDEVYSRKEILVPVQPGM